MRRVAAKTIVAFCLPTLLGACNTTTQLLTLERDNLVAIKKAETSIQVEAANATFDPAKFDLYLFLNAGVFNSLLQGIDDHRFSIDQGRPIDIHVSQVRLEFRPGYPTVVITADATDRKTGLVAELTLASAVLIEPHPTDPKKLVMRFVVSDVVPNLKWGPFELNKWLFARRLMQLKGLEFSQRLPTVDVPITRDFQIGGPAGQQVVNVPAGRGSMDVQVNWPSTLSSGTIAIKHVLFLRNGLHLFANVEGM